MDTSTMLNGNGTVSEELKVSFVAQKEVMEVPSVSITMSSGSSDRNSSQVKIEGSQIQPTQETSKPSETHSSDEDSNSLEKQKSSDELSLVGFDNILSQIEDWEDRLVTLKDYTSKRKERLTKKILATSSGNNVEEPEKRYSKPKLNYVSWATYEENGDGMPPACHYAIDILDDEPTPSQLRDSYRERQYTVSQMEEAKSSSLDPLAKFSEGKELPERIRINSKRLIVVLDCDVWDGSLRWWSDKPSAFIILRPFKILIHQERAIKNRLRDFEEARSKLKSATEEEYLKEFEKDPAEDDTVFGRQDEKSMSLSELTATINDMRCLTKFIDEILLPAQTRLQDPGQVRFSDLWYVFPQGSLVFVKDKNIPQRVWKVIQRTGGRRYLSRPDHVPQGEYLNKFSAFVLDCYHLDYDGIRYVPSYKRFTIDDFDGLQSVTALPLYPFETAVKERLTYREELLARGRQFMECIKVCHRYYSGRNHFRTPKGSLLSESASDVTGNVSMFSERIDSEVIVDFERALQEVPPWRPGNDDVKVYTMDINEVGESDNIDKDSVWDARFTEGFLEIDTQKRHQWEKLGSGPSADEDILLLPDRVFAFVLRTRKWACLQIGKNVDGEERLRPVIARPEPWNNLELPEGHKDIVQSLIESHFSKNKSQVHFDLVRDKGKGVIILLHGVPGVGKTSTAECAAESYNKPLLPITCGDLGLTPKEVEAKLQESFQLAQAWNCVMLLDEADIFLAQRTVTDTQRNALVSVFLRVLEYYEGILFLTTNRVGIFDEAFKSRIHISLYYPPLDWLQTKQIWSTHIKKATSENKMIRANHESLIEHAENLFKLQVAKKEFGPVWNGRQIRNAFQSAVALASFRCQSDQPIELSKEHFEKVSKVSNHFNNYLWRTRKAQTDADMARLGMLRDDGYVSASPQQPQMIISENYNQQLRSTFGQNVPQSMNPVPIADGYISHMVAQPAQQAQQPHQMYGMNGMNGMVPAQAVTGFGTQPQFQQPRQDQQPVFANPQGLYNPQATHMNLSVQNMALQAQYQQQQQQQQQAMFGGMGQTKLPPDATDLQPGNLPQ